MKHITIENRITSSMDLWSKMLETRIFFFEFDRITKIRDYILGILREAIVRQFGNVKIEYF